MKLKKQAMDLYCLQRCRVMDPPGTAAGVVNSCRHFDTELSYAPKLPLLGESEKLCL